MLHRFSHTTIRYFIPTVRHYYSFPVYIFHKMVDHVSPVWTFWSKFYASLTDWICQLCEFVTNRWTWTLMGNKNFQNTSFRNRATHKQKREREKIFIGPHSSSRIGGLKNFIASYYYENSGFNAHNSKWVSSFNNWKVHENAGTIKGKLRYWVRVTAGNRWCKFLLELFSNHLFAFMQK